MTRRRAWSLGCIVMALVGVFAWNPLLLQYRISRGHTALTERRFEDALVEFSRAEELAPQRADVQLWLARTQRRLGHLRDADTYLQQALEYGADEQRVQKERWLMLAQAGQMRQSEPHLIAMLRDPGEDGAEICEAYVTGLFANLRMNEAAIVLDAWEKDFPDDPEPHFMRAFGHEALSNPEEAVQCYERGLDMAPHRSQQRLRLGVVLMEARQYDAAREQLERVVEDSENPQATASLARCLVLLGESERARDLLQTSIEVHPDDFQTRQQLGQLCLDAGEFAEATVHLTVAAGIRSYDTEVRYSLAKALQALDRTEEAQPHFAYVQEAEEPLNQLELQLQEALADPRDAELRFRIGSTMLKYSDPHDAARWLRSALQIDPGHQAARQALEQYQREFSETESE